MTDFAKLSVKPLQNGAATGFESSFDIERFRVRQDFPEQLAGRQKTLFVPVARPNQQFWIQIHPDWRLSVHLLEDPGNSRPYLIAPELVPEMPGEAKLKMLVPYATRHGTFGLWPIQLPGEDGRSYSFPQSALSIVREHAERWIRVKTNLLDKCYYVVEPKVNRRPGPKWPDEGFNTLLEIGFKDRIIETLDHPVLRALRGEE